MNRIFAGLAAAAIWALAAFPAASATYYVSNGVTGNSDSNACTSASLPCATLVHAASLMSTSGGDTLYVGSHHSETLGTATTINFEATSGNYNSVFAVDDTNWPTNVTGSLVDPSSANFPVYTLSSGNLGLQNGVYIYGMEFQQSGTSTGHIIFNANTSFTIQRCQRCALFLTSTASGPAIDVGGGAGGGNGGSSLTMSDCEVKFGNANQAINLVQASAFLPTQLVIRNHGLGPFVVSGSTLPSNLFFAYGQPTFLTVEGVDLSTYTSGNILNANNAWTQAIFRNDVINSGAALSANMTTSQNAFVHFENTDTTGTNYVLNWKAYNSTVVTDTTTYRTGGATYDGTHGYSLKLTGTGASNPVIGRQVLPPINIGHLNSGSSTTITLYFLYDAANNTGGFNGTVQNNQFWMRVSYQGTASSTLASYGSTEIANYLPTTASATQGSASGSWTSSGLTTPSAYAMSVTFIPQAPGNYIIYPEAAIATNKTIWVDPLFTCSGNCPP